MEITLGIVLAIAAYLLGSVSPSYLLVRLTTGQDVRRLRSRNAGTLNTYHRLGIAGGVAVLLLDAAKGAAATLVPGLLGAPEWTVFATAPLVLVGHNWPVFLRFRGGKGAAVLLGVSLGLFPLVTAISLVPIALVMLVLRNVVVGAATGYVVICVALIATGVELPMIALSISLVVLAGVTYLMGFRREIRTMVREGEWVNLLLLRFPVEQQDSDSAA